jgi:hypothetical protein
MVMQHIRYFLLLQKHVTRCFNKFKKVYFCVRNCTSNLFKYVFSNGVRNTDEYYLFDSQKSFKMASTSSVIVAEKEYFDVFWASKNSCQLGPEP